MRSDIQVYTCAFQHIDALVEMTREFIEESKWGFTHDKALCQDQIFNYILSEESDILAVDVDGKMAGAAILIAHQDLCKEKLGFVHKFFISKPYRKTLAPRFLNRECAKWFDDKQCRVSFATATGHVDEASICAYTNLMAKYDYSPCGPTLCRFMKES